MKSFKEHLTGMKQILSQEDLPGDENLWKEWKSLVNMKLKDLESFYTSNLPEDPRKILVYHMLKTGKTFPEASHQWNSHDWKMCKKQVSTIKKYIKMRKRLVGNPFEKNGAKTNWYKVLLSWGHDPRKT